MMTLCHPVTGMPPTTLAYPMVGGRAGEFGWSRTNRDGSPRFHRGCDLSGDPGWPVFAAHDGKVARIGEESAGKGYGQRIYLQGFHGEQILLTIYAHLSGQNVELNEEIRAGHLLGWFGRSGNITTELTHLHHEIRLGGVGKPEAVNPAWFYHGTKYPRMGMNHPGGPSA